MLKIAVPIANELLCMHFGHCEEFAILEVDEAAKSILKCEKLTPPPHEPGVIPRWIAGLGVQMVIAGGMGPMAQQLLGAQGIQVLSGASPAAPEELVKAWLDGKLVCGANVCDHGHGHGHGHGDGEGHGNCHGHGNGHGCHQ